MCSLKEIFGNIGRKYYVKYKKVYMDVGEIIIMHKNSLFSQKKKKATTISTHDGFSEALS